jgi:hypothetical protein
MAQKKKRKITRRVGKYEHDKVMSKLDTYAISVREYYLSLRKAGFPVDQALGIINDRASYPDWLIPTAPDINPVNPDHDPYEDEDED